MDELMDGILRIIMNRSVVMMNVPKFVQLLLQEYFISSVCSNDNKLNNDM